MATEINTHFLVPTHEILEDPAAQAVLMNYGVDRSKLPKIRKIDPALPNGAKVGDIIRISRKSKTAGTAPYFRVVVE
jgi:DNA-directed RNA polymerase subunit H